MNITAGQVTHRNRTMSSLEKPQIQLLAANLKSAESVPLSGTANFIMDFSGLLCFWGTN
jgi:hypothetical protein